MAADPGTARPAPWTRRFAALTGLILALVVAANVYLVAASSERVVAAFDKTPPHPYALVLGSHVSPEGIPTRELAERLEMGRQLYRAGLARRIIVSGAVRPRYDEPDAMAAWLTRRGVAPADLVIDRGGYRTAASMADAAALGVDRLLVVSQPYHLPRALYLAKHAGLQATGVAAREPRRALVERIFTFVRETTARAEVIVEVALRGVQGLPAARIPQAPLG
ncbi:MAG TPA: ElyC/SanA/YdcF family protein [Polyangia bacterium]